MTQEKGETKGKQTYLTHLFQIDFLCLNTCTEGIFKLFGCNAIEKKNKYNIELNFPVGRFILGQFLLLVSGAIVRGQHCMNLLYSMHLGQVRSPLH